MTVTRTSLRPDRLFLDTGLPLWTTGLVNGTRRLSLLALLGFSAAAFFLPFHLATEEHDVPAEHSDPEDHGHDPAHVPHPSTDHQFVAISTRPQPSAVAFALELPAVTLNILPVESGCVLVPRENRGPPPDYSLSPSSARAPPL